MPKDHYNLDTDGALTANSDTRMASQSAVKTAVTNAPEAPQLLSTDAFARNVSGFTDGTSTVVNPPNNPSGAYYGNAVAVMDGGGDPQGVPAYSNRMFVKVPAGFSRPIELSGKMAFQRDGLTTFGLFVNLLITDLTETKNPGQLALHGLQATTFQMKVLDVPTQASTRFDARITHCEIDVPDLVIDRYWGLGFVLGTLGFPQNDGSLIWNLNTTDTTAGPNRLARDYSALMVRPL